MSWDDSALPKRHHLEKQAQCVKRVFDTLFLKLVFPQINIYLITFGNSAEMHLGICAVIKTVRAK